MKQRFLRGLIHQTSHVLHDSIEYIYSTLAQGSRIIFAEGSEGCQLVRAEANLNLIGA